MNAMLNKLKICVVSSAGGHLTEIRQLAAWYEKYDHFYIVESTETNNSFSEGNKVYFLKQVNRQMGWKLIPLMIYNTVIICKAYLKEKPDITITTGALATIPMCFLVKMFRRKLIYIESFARVNTQALTGKLLYKITDLFIVQHEEQLRFYPNARYVGNLF